MASAENTHVGLAKQVAKGTINATDNQFKYFMFNRGGIAPNNQYIPADDGIGSGSLLPAIEKGGVYSAGAFEFIPHPTVLGHFLTGALGAAASPVADGAGYKHVITFDTDEFDLPYYTFRSSPGGLWGETFKDCRIASFALNWRAADHIRAQMAVLGGTPTPNVSTAAWSPSPDNKPSLLAPTTVVTPFGGEASLKILRGSVMFGAAMPLDEQWITGAYEPDDFELVTRNITMTLAMKVSSAALYNKMSYDPSNGAAWVADMLKDGDIELHFKSSQEYDTNKPYALKIMANASETYPNVAWTVAPISLQAGRLVTMVATGTFLASSDGEPVTVELYNDYASQY